MRRRVQLELSEPRAHAQLCADSGAHDLRRFDRRRNGQLLLGQHLLMLVAVGVALVLLLVLDLL